MVQDPKFIISGGKPLRGKIEVKGSKNAALKLFAASLLTSQPVTITNVPDVEDIHRMAELLEKLGAQVEQTGADTYRVSAAGLHSFEIDEEISKRLRASIALTGPLLARTGGATFPHPGGCVIGKRPIDVFLDGFAAMGVSATEGSGVYELAVKKLRGAEYFFRVMSVTGTETMMMAAALAEGKTVLRNCACEPEISSLADVLNLSGAKIRGAGTHTIEIEGVKALNGGVWKVIPDRIEAGTFAIMAAATGSQLEITDCEPMHLHSLWQTLGEMGVRTAISQNSVRIIPSPSLLPVTIKTHEYPGFPTDLQAPLCVLLTQADGASFLHETIYEGRLHWTEDLKRMGANIILFDPHRLEVRGKTPLEGHEVRSPDLRAGMAYIIAALCAKGETVINNVYQIDRGYEKIEERLRKIGADIKRI